MTTETRAIKWHIGPVGDPMYEEKGFAVEVMDEGAGEFVCVTDNHDDCGSVRIDPGEWYDLRNAIDAAILACRDYPPSSHGSEQTTSGGAARPKQGEDQ